MTLEKKESDVHWPYLHQDEERKDGRHHVLLSEGREGDLTKDELEQVMVEDKNNSDKVKRKVYLCAGSILQLHLKHVY